MNVSAQPRTPDATVVDTSQPGGALSPAGALVRMLKRWYAADPLDDAARQLADRHFEWVWNRVQQRVAALPPAEARGYVQARAATIVTRAVEEASSHAPHRRRLYTMTMTRLTERVREHVLATNAAALYRRAA